MMCVESTRTGVANAEHDAALHNGAPALASKPQVNQLYISETFVRASVRFFA
jgi:hypothetical protein